MSFNFTGFDGNSHSLPAIPLVEGYDYYIILNFRLGYRVVYFKESLEIYRGEEGSAFSVRPDNQTRSPEYILNSDSTSWAYNTITSFNYGSSASVIYSSDSLLKYANDFNNVSGFKWDLSQEKIEEDTNTDTGGEEDGKEDIIDIPMSTLSTIVEKQENIPQDTFSEIFSIIPVLLTILVSIVGIRKAISFLLDLLRKS